MTEESFSVQINLREGTIQINGPVESMDDLFARVEEYLPKFQVAGGIQAEIPPPMEQKPTKKPRRQTKKASPTKQRKSSGGRKKYVEKYEIVDFGLSSEARNDFREFYSEKSPTNQNDQVLVIAYWLLNNTDREVVTREEIFTGFRMLDIKIPAQLRTVVSALAREGMITPSGKDFSLNHIGEDQVVHDLPVVRGSS